MWDENIEHHCQDSESDAINTRQSGTVQIQCQQLGPDTNSTVCRGGCATGPLVGAGVSFACVAVKTVSSGWIATQPIRLE